LENIKKATTNSQRNVLKNNNKVEGGGASCSRVKREQESTKVKA
jgi:hypothetical protein